MRGLVFTTMLMISMNANAGFGANATTSFGQIRTIEIQGLGVDAYYYFKPVAGNWGSTDCPNATAAYINKSAVGADAILAAALAAKATSVSVQFKGVCGNGFNGGTSDGFLYVNFITVQ
jgi:hypothetical protein